jgi:hypothetical protein
VAHPYGGALPRVEAGEQRRLTIDTQLGAPLDPSRDHHRIEHFQLPIGNSQTETKGPSRFQRFKTWIQKLSHINHNIFHGQSR